MLASEIFFGVGMYKMKKISKKAYKKCWIEIITEGKYFLNNRRDLEIESGYKNWAVIFDKCDPEKQKYWYELMPNTKFQPCKRFVRNDLAEKKYLKLQTSIRTILRIQRKVRIRL